jgi:hypothetical protein
MYIRDFEVNYIADDGYGYHPSVKLSIDRCTKADLEYLQRLVQDVFDIEIVSSEALKILQDEYASRYRYCFNDVVNTLSLCKRSNSTDDLKVTKVIYHNPATIVFWSDGTKTVVKCGKDDTYDKEKGFYIACAKKLFGNDYKAVGRMNKALEMAVTQTKLERMTMDDVLLPEEEK